MGENNFSKDKINKTSKLNYTNGYKAIWKETKDNYAVIIKYLLISILVSIGIQKLFWWRGSGAVHSILELIPILVNMSLFFMVWNKYKESPNSSRIIALGLFTTTIYDVLHTYFYGTLGFAIGEYYDLGPRFWILGRSAEILGIFIASFNIKGVLDNKWASATIAAAIPVSISYLNINYANYFPQMFNGTEVTFIKIASESIIIILAVISLYRHKKKINEVGYISHRYLSIALLFIIPTEICFMLYSSYSSAIMVYGHVLRIVYCYFLHKSTFQSSINYDYEELEHSKKRLNDILDALPIGILTYDHNKKIDFANKEYESLLSCSREDVIGLTNRELFEVFTKVNNFINEPLPEDMAKDSKDMKSTIRTFLDRDGNPVNLQSEAVQIEGGSLFMVRDATMEQKVDNLHLQTRTVLNSMQNAAFICDNRGRVMESNKAFRKLTGLTAEETAGVNILKLTELLNHNVKENVLLGQDEHGIHEQFESSFINKNGNKVEVIIHKSQILNLFNETVGTIYVLTDISDLKEQQQKKLHQEKLALLGQMGATIVHETRNFLTTIKGCSQLIEVTAKQDSVVRYARKINKNTDEVNRIISDFLSLSKPKNAILEEVAACDLLQSLRNTLESSCIFKGINIEYAIELDERYVLCDEAQMKQVMLNICKNAAEAMAETANPKLVINAGIAEENGGLFIKVTDNGKGMNKETLEKVGTLFFTTKQGGTGLGLSVCHDIVKSHGGRLEASSEEGKGTTFTINIPGIEYEEEESAV